MRHKLAFCFSGQGSHYYKMGKELYYQNQTFKSWMDRLDDIAKAEINESVTTVLYNDKFKKGDCFDRTIITHPAIFMFEYSLYRVFVEKNIYPDCVLGTSLGEFTAACAADIINFKDALKMVIRQAEIIEKVCPKAGMMALLYRLDYFEELKEQYPDIELASSNSENHFVISGKVNSLNRISEELKSKNIICQILHVSYGFHSNLVESAAPHYLEYLKSFEYKKPSIPYISSVTGTYLDDPAVFHSGYFWDICRKPVLFKDTIKNIEKNDSFYYLDLGPSGTLVNFIKNNLDPSSLSRTQTVISPFGRDLENINKGEEFIRAGRI